MSSPFFNFPAVYIFFYTHIESQIDILNSFSLLIIPYKHLSLVFPYDLSFLYDLIFPLYNYFSKIHFFFFLQEKVMYTKNFSKIKEKADSHYHNESQHINGIFQPSKYACVDNI